MVHHSDEPSLYKLLAISNMLVLSMLIDMVRLSSTRESIPSIIRYLVVSHSYHIKITVIGECPYPDEIVPWIWCVYSQTGYIGNTLTTRVINAHFRTQPDGVESLRNLWRLLPKWYLFINTYSSFSPTNSVILLKRMNNII